MSQSDGRSTARPGTAHPGSAGTSAAKPSPTQSSSTKPSAGSTNSGSQDVVLIHGPTEDQAGLHVLRARPQGIEVGVMRPLEEGKPLSGEVVKLRPRPGTPRVCDVETQFSKEELDGARAATPPRLGHPGPPRVTTEAYRANWEAIYRLPEGSGTGDLN
jgi:hypothetical protein